jgi:predicted nuclease with TOPRIM domain
MAGDDKQPQGLEEAVNEKHWKITTKDIKWLVSLVITVIIGGSTILYLWNDRQDIRSKLDSTQTELNEIKEENVGLRNRLSKVEGKQEGTQDAITLFLEHPPSIMQTQIDANTNKINQVIDKLHIRINTTNVDTTSVETRPTNTSFSF